MAATTHLMTVEEFSKLPKDDGPVYNELRHGEVVPVSRPKARHYRAQRRLRRLLETFAPPEAMVDTEFAFRPSPEHELRVADVAYVAGERWDEVGPDEYLQGSPELVIEILSPSNTVAEMFEKEKLCLETGSQEFWVIDADRRQVKVSTPDGHTIRYQSGQDVPLRMFGGGKLAVDEMFAAGA